MPRIPNAPRAAHPTVPRLGGMDDESSHAILPARGADADAATVGRLRRDLGEALIEVGAPGPGHRDAPVTGVVLHDDADDSPLRAGAFVLGVGARGPAADALVRECVAAGCSAVMLRDAGSLPADVREAARAGGVRVFSLPEEASWLQLALSIATSLGQGDDDRRPDEESAAADLFGIADSIAALVGGPVTVEDLASQVIAYSADQEAADQARRDTIVGRGVLPEHGAVYRAEGTFRRIYAEDEVVWIPAGRVGNSLPRAVMRIAHRGEVLGSVWAARHPPMTDEEQRVMREGARMLAIELLRAREARRARDHAQVRTVRTLLRGGDQAEARARELWPEDPELVLIAIAIDRTDEPDAVGSLERVEATLRVQLSSEAGRPQIALIDDVVYVVSAAGPTAGSLLERVDTFVRQWPQAPLLAVHASVLDPVQLARRRERTDAALRAAPSGSRLIDLDDLQAHLLMHELRTRLRSEGATLSGPLSRVAAYDDRHDGSLLPTLRAWLEHGGSTVDAARALHIHANTCRYRLQRAQEIAGIDLDDPAQRFHAQFLLRVFL